MNKAVAIQGSPRMEKGNTEMVLTPFIQGMRDAGAEVEPFYAGCLAVASSVRPAPCLCLRAGHWPLQTRDTSAAACLWSAASASSVALMRSGR